MAGFIGALLSPPTVKLALNDIVNGAYGQLCILGEIENTELINE